MGYFSDLHSEIINMHCYGASIEDIVSTLNLSYEDVVWVVESYQDFDDSGYCGA